MFFRKDEHPEYLGKKPKRGHQRKKKELPKIKCSESFKENIKQRNILLFQD